MTSEQQAAYGDASEVHSDALGLIPRDNQNHHAKRRYIQYVVRASPGDRVLEVGCGSGLHTEAYADVYDLTAVDLSESLVERAQQRAPSADVRQMDARRLEFVDDAFQAVVGTAILHHLPDARAALQEWLRVTRSGGSVTLMEPNYLFPKDFASAHLVAEEKHKTQMAPWRVRRLLEAVDCGGYRHEPRLYTPPWPERWISLYDSIDSLLRAVPLVRWLGMMQLIHVRV